MNTFSQREWDIIKIIGRRKLTFEQISSELFRKGDKPFDDTITVGNSIRRIIKKCGHHKLAWTLEKIRKEGKLYVKKIKL